MSLRQSPAIAVMGAGAVGCFYGGRFAAAGFPVMLIGRQGFVDAVRERGLLFESGGTTETIKAGASSDPAAVAGARIVLVSVKSADTDDAARAIAPHLAPDAVVLSLQNGVDNPDRIRTHVKNPVLPALVYTAAQIAGPGHVRHTGGGHLVIGGAPRPMLDDIVALFKSAGLSIGVSNDVNAELWAKLLMNCAYNAVSALAMAPYARMTAMPEVRAVMREAADEVVAVARAKGVSVNPAVLERMFDMGQTMPTQISSTAQDLAKGRKTEIDYLNGYVAREGAALGIDVPVNRTLYALVKLREQAAAA